METARALRKKAPLFVDERGNQYHVIHKDSPTIKVAHTMWRTNQAPDRGGLLVCLFLTPTQSAVVNVPSVKSPGKLVRKRFKQAQAPDTFDDELLLATPDGKEFYRASIRQVDRPKQRGPMGMVALDNIRNHKTGSLVYHAFADEPDEDMTPDDDEKSINDASSSAF